jgi:hypothetical protein
MYWLAARDPEALARGATMLVGNPVNATGDVEWTEQDFENGLEDK